MPEGSQQKIRTMAQDLERARALLKNVQPASPVGLPAEKAVRPVLPPAPPTPPPIYPRPITRPPAPKPTAPPAPTPQPVKERTLAEILREAGRVAPPPPPKPMGDILAPKESPVPPAPPVPPRVPPVAPIAPTPMPKKPEAPPPLPSEASKPKIVAPKTPEEILGLPARPIPTPPPPRPTTPATPKPLTSAAAPERIAFRPPPPKPIAPQPPQQKEKVPRKTGGGLPAPKFIIVAGVLALIIIAAGGLLLTKLTQKPAPPPPPPAAPQPIAQPAPESLFETEERVVIKLTSTTYDALKPKIEALQDEALLEGAIASALVQFSTPTEIRYLTLSEILDILQIDAPPAFAEWNDATLFLYGQTSEIKIQCAAAAISELSCYGPRLGIAARIPSHAIALRTMQEWEKTIIDDFAPLMFTAPQEPAEKTFRTGSFDGLQTRFVNLLPSSNLSIDWILTNTHLVIGTSRDAARAALTQLKDAQLFAPEVAFPTPATPTPELSPETTPPQTTPELTPEPTKQQEVLPPVAPVVLPQ